MKKILSLLVLLPLMVVGQTQNENYIKTTTYKLPTATSIANPTITQANQNITYFDGLGRPIQQIAHQQSGTGKDIVTPIEYDGFGRQAKDYLPYVPNAAASLNYKSSALTDVLNFPQYSGQNPYSEKRFEASPLNRVLQQAAPGTDWALDSGHEIKLEYQTNTTADQVKRFGVSFIGGNTENPYLEEKGIYDINQLYKTITKDENWSQGQYNPKNHTTQEFKDKQGRVVLKRTFDDNQWLDTYYVYDDYGNLTFVLPPKVDTYGSITQGFVGQSPSRSTDNGDDISFFTGINSFNYFDISKNGENLSFHLYAYNFTQGALLKTGKISDLDFTPDLPNMTLGDIIFYDNSDNAVRAGEAYIQNGDLYFLSSGVGLSPDNGDIWANGTTNLVLYQANYSPPALDRSTLDDLIYQYKYDYRNRLVEKKLPGKQWEFIVYDKLDRVVATGPAFSPFNDITTVGWLITKYDAFNRVIYTGWENTTATSSTRTSKQTTQNGLTTSLNEYKVAPGYIDVMNTFYSNIVAPTAFKLLTINYYDNYDFSNAPTFPAYSYNGRPSFYNNSTMKPKGMPTGSWTRVLSTSSSLAGETNYVLYDYKARPIRNYTMNHLGGFTRTDIDLDFTGKTTYTYSTHKRSKSTSDAQIWFSESFTYSPQDRLLTHTHSVNGMSAQLLASNTYDELGQLISKKVGNTAGTPLQKVDYDYNIRGWLTGINNDPTNNLVLNTTEKDLFSFKINYDSIVGNIYGVKPLYNGNISETYWRTTSDNVLRKYGYAYDNLNRLTNAFYQKPGGNNFPTYHGYGESNITYDKNGNIKTLSRTGDLENALPANIIDQLSYSYKSNSNQLTKVLDHSNNTSGFNDGNLIGDDYSYDANGNMITDKNKGITEIIYNHLNLPTKITFGTKGTISYIYNSMGEKIEKTVYQAPKVNCGLKTTITTDYLSGFQYMKTANSSCTGRYALPVVALQFFPTAAGYVKNTNGVYSYVFNYTDHLGNVRVSYEKDAASGALKILEENNYYPFGMKHSGYNGNNAQPTYKYKFQGQERQDELGLNWDSFKWRNYMPDIGRFFNPDPLSEQYAYQSHYNFSENRVIDGRELEGLEYVSVHHYANGAVSKTEYYKMGNSQIKRLGGTTAGIHNSVPYGAGGKGIAHYYYNDAGNRTSTHWEQRQTGGTSDFAYHGLYSGPGSITYDGISGSENYNFDAQPIDYADAIAKRHDMDYAEDAGENYAGYLEDVRTLKADRDMVRRIDDFTNPFRLVKGIETPVKTSYSTEMDFSMLGQRVLINALATYKQWKVDNKFGNDNLYKDNREAFGKAHPATAKILDQLPD